MHQEREFVACYPNSTFKPMKSTLIKINGTGVVVDHNPSNVVVSDTSPTITAAAAAIECNWQVVLLLLLLA
jgi:hypothetical protein